MGNPVAFPEVGRSLEVAYVKDREVVEMVE